MCASLQGRAVLMGLGLLMITGCAAVPPSNTHAQDSESQPCQTRSSRVLTALAGICVAAGQATGAAMTGDLSQGGAAALTLGTVFLPNPAPLCRTTTRTAAVE